MVYMNIFDVRNIEFNLFPVIGFISIKSPIELYSPLFYTVTFVILN